MSFDILSSYKLPLIYKDKYEHMLKERGFYFEQGKGIFPYKLPLHKNQFN